MSESATPRTPNEIMWASGSLAPGLLFNAMALFSLFFMTTILGIGAATAGLLIFASKLFDGITDPAMGAISDRTRHRWGPRRPYLAWGALLMGASFAVFFNLPAVEGVAVVWLALAALLLYSASYTVFTVPYLAMPPDIATSYDGRTRVMSFRVFFLMVGVLAGSAGAPVIVQSMGGGAEGFRLLGLLLGGLAAAMGLVAFFGSRPLPFPKALDSRGESFGKLALSPFVDMVAVLRNQPFLQLTLVKLCQLAVLAVALACTPYFFTFVLQRSPADIGIYLLVFGLSGIASLALWRPVIARFGKKSTYMALLVAYAAGMGSWFFWQPGEAEVFFYARAVFIGMASTGTVLCALALLPDTMEYDRLSCGRSRDGIMSGVFTLVEKLAGAIGPLVIGSLLGAMGLVTGRDPDIVQPESALFAVKLGMSVVPAVFCLAAIPFLMAYRLDRQGLEEARLQAAQTSGAA